MSTVSKHGALHTLQLLPASMTPLKDFHDPASVADFLAKVGVDPATGLTRADAMTRRSLHGANRVTPPVNCPSWVCCLLPCLLRTPSMQAYQLALPRDATVKRLQGNGQTRTLRMDAASLVYGDVVHVSAGDVIGADFRVIECSDDCVVDQSSLVGTEVEAEEDVLEGGRRKVARVKKRVTVDATDKKDPLASGNVLLMATEVVAGRAVGVVIATGDATVWGQMLQQHEWPVRGGARRQPRHSQYGASGEDEALVSKA